MNDDSADIKSLPHVFPVFPLSSVILIPGSTLPLNIFEPRYLQMVRDAVTSAGLIGMVQPKANEQDETQPELYTVGGIGRISDLKEIGENRFSIKLTGLARFEVINELSVTTPYRQIQASWERFADGRSPEHICHYSRRELLATLSDYLDFRGLDADFDAISEAPDDVLANTLSMIIPFGVPEKQALLEAQNASARADILKTLLQMALVEGGRAPVDKLH
jgi:Lon protease-like protein